MDRISRVKGSDFRKRQSIFMSYESKENFLTRRLTGSCFINFHISFIFQEQTMIEVNISIWFQYC